MLVISIWNNEKIGEAVYNYEGDKVRVRWWRQNRTKTKKSPLAGGGGLMNRKQVLYITSGEYLYRTVILYLGLFCWIML